jgi:acetyl esterase/lipase
VFRAARFKDGKRSEKALVSMYFNGIKVHTNQSISQVWGGPNSGIDGGNDSGKGITDVPGGLKLQAEGHHVLYRNIWAQDLNLDAPDTDLMSYQIPLWTNGAPGFEQRRNEPEQAKDWWVKNIHNPSVTVFPAPKSKATGAAVLICPGGGHSRLVYNSEGRAAAEYLNSIGITAFVLKYRLFREEGSPYTEANTRQDGLRAMRLIRSRAAEWGIDPQKIGILGFSAGGELAAWTAFADGAAQPAATDPVEKVSARPDFQVLIYPGPLAVPAAAPTGKLPPAFLLAANDDECCSAPILQLADLYRRQKSSLELHLYAQGSHAFNMGQRTTLTSVKNWPQRLNEWLQDNGISTAK